MKLTLTEEEFNQQLRFSLNAACEECRKIVAIKKIIDADNKEFCSERCKDRNLAPLIKPQPKTTGPAELQGWTW